MVDEQKGRCISPDTCTKSGNLISLDEKFCKVLGDLNCEKETGPKDEHCGCINFVLENEIAGPSCVSSCGFFEPRYEKEGNQYFAYLDENSNCVNDDNNLVLDPEQKKCKCDPAKGLITNTAKTGCVECPYYILNDACV